MARTRRGSGPTPTPGGNGPPKRTRRDGRVKCTYLLDLSHRREVAVVAASEGTEASRVVADALEAYLPRFSVVKGLRRAAVPAPAAESAEPAEGEGIGGASDDNPRDL